MPLYTWRIWPRGDPPCRESRAFKVESQDGTQAAWLQSLCSQPLGTVFAQWLNELAKVPASEPCPWAFSPSIHPLSSFPWKSVSANCSPSSAPKKALNYIWHQDYTLLMFTAFHNLANSTPTLHAHRSSCTSLLHLLCSHRPPGHSCLWPEKDLHRNPLPSNGPLGAMLDGHLNNHLCIGSISHRVSQSHHNWHFRLDDSWRVGGHCPVHDRTLSSTSMHQVSAASPHPFYTRLLFAVVKTKKFPGIVKHPCGGVGSTKTPWFWEPLSYTVSSSMLALLQSIQHGCLAHSENSINRPPQYPHTTTSHLGSTFQ